MQVRPGLSKTCRPALPSSCFYRRCPFLGADLLNSKAQVLDHLQPTPGHTFLSQRSRRAQGTHACQSWACSAGRPPAERSQRTAASSPCLGPHAARSLLDAGRRNLRAVGTGRFCSPPDPSRLAAESCVLGLSWELVMSPPLSYGTWSLARGLLAEHRRGRSGRYLPERMPRVAIEDSHSAVERRTPSHQPQHGLGLHFFSLHGDLCTGPSPCSPLLTLGALSWSELLWSPAMDTHQKVAVPGGPWDVLQAALLSAFLAASVFSFSLPASCPRSSGHTGDRGHLHSHLHSLQHVRNAPVSSVEPGPPYRQLGFCPGS